MIRNELKVDAKRRSTLNHKRQQFALPAFRSQEYPHRLNLYDVPPIEDITLEQLCVITHYILAGQGVADGP
jgi:DNA primase large subunit